jgi:prephenate dehydrogenase
MKIGVVGLGLMGGSVAAALKPHHEIHAYDIDCAALSTALERGFVDRAHDTPRSLLSVCDVVYLCLYPRDLCTFIADHAAEMRPGLIVAEIAGVKKTIMDTIGAISVPGVEIVFTHPIAGREKIGCSYADPAIFRNANYVIVPTDKNSSMALETIRSLAHEMGFGNVSDLTAEEHDAIIAYTSQLTHVRSLALVGSDDDAFDTGRFIGDSYRDLTRIAMINAPLWSELFLENKTNLLRRIRAFREELDRYEKMIESDDSQGLSAKMTEAGRRRRKLEGGK